MRVVGGLLNDPRLRADLGPGQPLLRAGVLDFLDDVAYGARFAAESGAPVTTSLSWPDVGVTPQDVDGYYDALSDGPDASEDGSAVGRLWEWSSADLSSLDELVDIVLPLVDDPDLKIGLRAVYVLTRLGGTPVARSRSRALCLPTCYRIVTR